MKLKRILVSVSIVLWVASCSNVSTTTEKAIVDSTVEHASVEDVVLGEKSSDTVDFYPVYLEDSLPLKMLLNDVYSDKELLPLIRMYNWWALETDSNETKFQIAKANIKLIRTSEPMGDEKDSSWIQIQNGHSNSAIIYIAGSKKIKAHEVKTVTNSPLRIMPGDEKIINFNNQSYTLRATGSLDSNQYGIHPSNYSLTVSNGKSMTLLSSAPYFDDAMIEILFIGDIDGDGLLDFLIDNSNKYSYREYCLYLSSFATKGECVKLVAGKHTMGC